MLFQLQLSFIKNKNKNEPYLDDGNGEWRVAGDCLSGGTTAEAAVGIIIFLWNGGEAGVKGLGAKQRVTIYIYTNNLIYKTVEVAPNFGYNRKTEPTEWDLDFAALLLFLRFYILFLLNTGI